MQNWLPYLHNLLGDDEHGREQAQELVKLILLLGDDRLQVRDRVRLLDGLSRLDSVRQIFLLPWLLDLLSDPSWVVRQRLLALLDELLGYSQTPLLDQLGKLTDPRAPKKTLTGVLGALSGMLRGEEVDPQTPFAALLFLRTPVFGLATLLSLSRWAQFQEQSDKFYEEIQTFFAEEEQAPLRELLGRLLRSGPIFLRYLIVRWLGRSGVALDLDDPAQLLYHRYLEDSDPLVAGTAIEAYARQVEPRSLHSAVDAISKEYVAFWQRPLEWQERPGDEAVRALSLSQMRALGYLAQKYYPDPKALQALKRLIKAWPYTALNLRDSDLLAEQRRNVFCAGLLLWGTQLRVRLKPRLIKGKLFGLAGFRPKVQLEDPRGVLKSHPDCETVWAAAVRTDQSPDNPLVWRYEILEPVKSGKVRGAYDLMVLLSPALSCFLAVEKRPSEFSVRLRSQIEQEIDRRGWWMLQAGELVAELVVVGVKQGDRLDGEPLRDFFSYLADLAIAANLCRPDQNGGPRQRLKNQMRSIFLNRFARQEVFDFLFPDRQVEPLVAQLLTELATTALRSLPEAPANAWIAKNHHVLRSITLRSDLHERLRGNAIAALQFHGARFAIKKEDSEDRALRLEPIERDLFRLPGRKVYHHCPQALAFVSDEDLEVLRRDELRSAPLKLLADRCELAQPEQGRIVLLWSEILARSLERDEPGSWDAQHGAGVCLGALAAKEPFHTLTRLRLLYAFGSCSVLLEGNSRRLLDHLLRTSSSAELQLYLDITHDWHERPELVRQLLSMLTQKDQDIALGGSRRFDIHGIADRLARRRVILRALAAQSRNRPGFYQTFRRVREERPLPRETDRVVPARGEVLPEEAEPNQPVEKLSILRPLADPGRGTLAQMGGDLLPSFVHHPQSRTPLHCLMHLHPAAPGLIDFHGLPLSPLQKQTILEQWLADEPHVRVLARVERCEGGGEYRVDLGVGMERTLHEKPVLSFDRSLRPDDAAVVEIRRHTGEKRVLTEVKLRPWLGGEEGVRVVDLRGEAGALDRLETLWNTRQDFKLRATVKKLIPQESGNVLCLLDIGFQWQRQDENRLPAVFLAEDLPEVGDEILIDRPAYLKFETLEIADLETLHLEAVGQDSVPEGWIVSGTLHSKRLARSGRRRWRGRIGQLDLPVERGKLSGDLHKLFALDEKADDAPALRRLATEPTLFKVVDQTLSVLDAPPSWRGFDLVLAVEANQVDRMIFLERRGSRQMLFEIGWLDAMASEADQKTIPATNDSLPAFGVLALLDEGELFDETGDPVGDGLRPGEIISLKVTAGRLLADGRLLPSPRGGKAEPWDVPYLQIADKLDDNALRFRDAFPRNSLVRVRLSGASGTQLELLGSDPGFPTPLVLPDPEEPRALRGVPGTEVDAMVTGDWEPESEDFTLTVGRVRERYLHLPSRSEDRQRDFLRYLRLDAGMTLQGRKYFIDEREQLSCFVRGLKVYLDSQLRYLVPESLTAQKLNESTVSAPVRLTAVTRVQRALRISSDLPPIQGIERHQVATGLVVSTSAPGSGSKQIGVLWRTSHLEKRPDQVEISERWCFEPPIELYNGDVLHATARKDGRIELIRVHRHLTGTILHRAVSCTSWASSLPGPKTRGLVATLLRKPESLEESWLFAFAPAHLVQVEPEQLQFAQRLDDAWSLDRVRFDLRWEIGGMASKVRLEVQEVRPGPLHAAMGKQLTLEVQSWKTGRFSCVLRGPGEMEKLGGIPLELGPNELPPHQSPKVLTQQFRSGGRQTIPVKCTLAGYRLEVSQEIDEDDPQPRLGYEFEFRLQLDSPQRQQPESPVQKPSLDEALEATGRIDRIAGRVVEVEEGLAVRLSSYQHLDPLPLPISEITWIRHTGDLVSVGFEGTFTVLRDDEGRPFASLRRKPPLTLTDWLRKKRLSDVRAIVDDHRLLYFAALDESDLEECGLPQATDEEAGRMDPLVLFESEPGVSVVAHASELRFLNWPFDSKTLRSGDAVLSFELLDPPTPEEEEASGKIFNILKIELDIARQVEDFAKHHGLHFGRVRLENGGAVLEDLRGADYRSGPVSRRRLARWQLRLEKPDAEQLKWLAELGKDDFVYLKLVRVKHETGEFMFRLATSDEVFSGQNLVFVRAKQIAPYGDSRRLMVEPLSDGFSGEYMIPDTLFSERRGRLESSHRVIGGIYMARVYQEEIYEEKPSVRLSLIHTPWRRFGYLMSEDKWQAIVKNVDPHRLTAEVAEGVNAEIPRNRIMGVTEIWQQLQRGDVLMLRRREKEYRVELVDRVRSHMAYLDLNAQRTILTELWGSSTRRAEQFERRGVLNCNLIGLPQLRAISQLSETTVHVQRPLPQVIRGQERGWIHVEEGVGADAFVGRLHLDEEGLPQIRNAAGERVTVRWDQLTCFEGVPEAKRSWLAKQHWRNSSLNEKIANIAKMDVIARRSKSSASLTRMADLPFPVDHLVEQFPPQEPGRRPQASRLSFVVARAEPERLILELAPGRYAELPTSLIRPLHDGRLQSGLVLDWGGLARGDQLQIERCAMSESSEELLPQFRIRALEPGHSRHFTGPLWSVLRRLPDGRIVLGSEGGPGIPADHLARLLRDHLTDLGQLPEGWKRDQQLRVLFKRHGSRLVLEGRVGGFRAEAEGGLYFLKIGIAVPIPGRDQWGDPAVRIAAEPPLPKGTALRIRVLDAAFSADDILERFRYRLEPDYEQVSRACSVRSVNGRFKRCDVLPADGDAVMVYRPTSAAEDECSVVGLEDYSVVWDAHVPDPLQLNHPKKRQLVFARVLTHPDAVLWATVESLDYRRRQVRLSLRFQLERALPKPGHVARARVVAALSGRWLLVDLLGIPRILPVNQLFRGVRADLDLSPWIERSPIEVEVVASEDGTLAAGAYHQPIGEFEATIEHILPVGVLARSKGCRFFVEKRELSWCQLDDDLLERLFPCGRTLRLVQLAHKTRLEVFSHIRTYDIRSEITELIHTGGPAYVSLEHLDETECRAIVRGRSGVLMELYLPAGPELPQRFCAFVGHIDESNRQIILSLQAQPIRIWDLPAVPRSYAVDRLTTRLIEAQLETLRHQLVALGPKGPGVWAREQNHLEPRPRNLRLVLEQITEVLGVDAVWKRPEDPETETICDFYAVWRELSAVLCGNSGPESITGPARFALGYWLVQREDFETAAEQLDQAICDEALRDDFDVQLTRARAHYLAGRTAKGTSLLRELTQRLWASALRTLTVPLFEPEPPDPQSELPVEWNVALKAGRLEPLEQMLRRQAASELLSSRSLAQEIWLVLARGDSDKTLDTLTESFFDALRADVHQQPIDPRFFGLAAYLSFARGDVVGGWSFLDRLASAPSVRNPELAPAEFWRIWLDGEHQDVPSGSSDPLLSALVPVLRQSRWRRVCDSEVFDRLWQIFRTSRQCWHLSSPLCRALPEPPNDYEKLLQWAEDHGATSTLRFLCDDLDRERESSQ